MNTKEIEEAVKSLTLVTGITKDGTGFLNRKALDTALKVMQEYLAVKGLPEGKEEKHDGSGNNLCQYSEAKSFNQALHLCKLALLKKEAEWKEKIPSEEEMNEFLQIYFSNKLQDKEVRFNTRDLATVIRKMLEERIK